MGLAFPVLLNDFINTLKIERMKLDIAEFADVQGTEGGEVYTSILSWPKWTAEVSFTPMSMEEARRARALMRRIGVLNSFRLNDPERLYPVSDPDGDVVSGSNVQVHTIDGRTLRLKGLPSGYTLTWGDLGTITHGTTKYLFEVANDTIAASGGGVTPAFDVNPMIPENIAVDDVVLLTQPYGCFKFLERDIGETLARTTSGVSFKALQVMS